MSIGASVRASVDASLAQGGSQHNVLEATLRAGLDPDLGSAAVRY